MVVNCGVLYSVANSLGDPDFEAAEEALEEDIENYVNNSDKLPLRHPGQEIRRILNIVINNFNDNKVSIVPVFVNQLQTEELTEFTIVVNKLNFCLSETKHSGLRWPTLYYPRKYKVIITSTKRRKCLYFYLLLQNITLYFYLLLQNITLYFYLILGKIFFIFMIITHVEISNCASPN